jgi:ABC-type lipoprotein release transport system permease subunit
MNELLACICGIFLGLVIGMVIVANMHGLDIRVEHTITS